MEGLFIVVPGERQEEEERTGDRNSLLELYCCVGFVVNLIV